MAAEKLENTPSVIDARWVVAVRLCIVVTALLSLSVCTFLGTPETAERVRFLFVPVAGLFFINAVSALWLRFTSAGQGFYLAHLLLDIPVITGVVYVTGDCDSPFVFLYLLLVMVATPLVSLRVAIALAALNTASYGAVIWMVNSGALLPADGSAPVRSLASILFKLGGTSSGMLLVAVGMSYLTSRLRSNTKLLEESQESLKALSSGQTELLANFPGGVITTGMDLTLKSINASARALLGFDTPHVESLKLTTILPSITGAPRSASEWLERENETFELEVVTNDKGPARHIEARCKPVHDGLGSTVGLAVFLHDVTELRSAEEKLELQERMARLLAEHQRKESLPSALGELIGESPIMQKVFDVIRRVSSSEATVLITGESGTGKELVARAIHYNSPRSQQPFVAVNCGAIPENLIESELFGHKKGAFTGADSDSIGLFRRAHGGTLFLDEIGELPLLMQAKLLRSLQEKTVRPVGSSTDIPVDVRIVAATNRNIKREVEQSAFREDLYYRLNVIGVHLPPLRDRRDDIPLLMQSLLHRLCRGGQPPVVSPQAAQLLVSYGYPGNVRELENILERAIVLGGDAILPEHLPESVQKSSKDQDPAAARPETVIMELSDIQLPVDLDTLLSAIEKRYLEMALSQTGGAKKQAASLLGMNFRSFRYRLHKFGMALDHPDAKS